MNQAVRKVGFLCLPDDMLEIFSAMTRRPGYRPEVVVDFDPNAYSYRMAEILQIPTGTDLEILRKFPCNVLVIPDNRPDLREAAISMTGNDLGSIVTVSEIAAELGLSVAAEEEDYRPVDFFVPSGTLEATTSPSGENPEPELKGTSRLTRDSETGMHNLRDRLVIDRMKTWNDGRKADETGENAMAAENTPGQSPDPGNRDGQVEAKITTGSTERPEALKIPEPGAGEPAQQQAAAVPELKRPPRTTSPAEAIVNKNISEVAETLSLAFDKHLLLHRILEIAVTSAGGDAGSIMLLDESGEYLKIAVATGLSEEVIRSTRQRVGEGVAGNVLMEGRGRVVTDLLNDPRYRSGRDRGAISAAVCAPIRVGTRAIGIINISSMDKGDAFDANTLTLLDKFGIQVAGVILKALELPAEEESPGNIPGEQVDAIMARPDPLPRRLEAVADKLASLIGAAVGHICLFDPTGRRLEVLGGRSHSGPPGLPKFVPADEGLRGWVLRKREAETLMSSRSDGDRRAIFYVPLIGSELLGLIEMESVPVDEALRVEILESLTGIAARIAARIERDRRERSESRRTEQMLRLSDVAADMMCTTDSEEIITLALRATGELFCADLVTFHNPTDASMTLNNPEFGERGDAASLAVLDFNGELCAEARGTGHPVTLTTMTSQLTQRLTTLGQVNWAAALPLSSGDRDAGTLSLFGMKEESQPPSEAEWAVLEKLGSYMIRALDRAAVQGSDATLGFLGWSIFQDRLSDEFKRANRYGRTFALITLELEGFRHESAEMGRSWTDAARYALADFVRHEVREVDIVSWIQEGRIAVLSPEVGSEESALSRRIEDHWEKLLPSLKLEHLDKTPMQVRVVHFPTDIKTWEDCVGWIQDPFADNGPEIRAAG